MNLAQATSEKTFRHVLMEMVKNNTSRLQMNMQVNDDLFTFDITLTHINNVPIEEIKDE